MCCSIVYDACSWAGVGGIKVIFSNIISNYRNDESGYTLYNMTHNRTCDYLEPLTSLVYDWLVGGRAPPTLPQTTLRAKVLLTVQVRVTLDHSVAMVTAGSSCVI